MQLQNANRFYQGGWTATAEPGPTGYLETVSRLNTAQVGKSSWSVPRRSRPTTSLKPPQSDTTRSTSSTTVFTSAVKFTSHLPRTANTYHYTKSHIIGSAVVLHCIKAHRQSQSRSQILTPPVKFKPLKF